MAETATEHGLDGQSEATERDVNQAASNAGGLLLGMAGGFGFAGTDLTNPHGAAERGALPDLRDSLKGMPLELRIHGIGGSRPEVMLEHPSVIQVGGDDTGGFFRRWCPEGEASQATIPRRLEAYSWGKMTARAVTGPLWLLLVPFQLLNLASWMLPAAKNPRIAARTTRDRLPQALLRLLGLALTLAFVASLITTFADVIAWQAAHQNSLPSWAGAFTHLSPGIRIGLALLMVAIATGVLTAASMWTTSQYEAWNAEEKTQQAEDDAINAYLQDPAWPLRSPWFWRGFEPARRQCWLHAAAALALIGTMGGLALPQSSPGLRWTATGVSLGILALATGLTSSLWADRSQVLEHQARKKAAKHTIRRVLGALAWAALISMLVNIVLDCLYTDPGKWPRHQGHASIPALLPGESWLWALLAIAEIGIVLLLAALTLIRRAAKQSSVHMPRTAKFAMPLMAALACIVGGVLGCGLVLTITKLLSTSTVAFIGASQVTSHSQVLVPYIIYSYGAGAALALAIILFVLAPIGIACCARRAVKLRNCVEKVYRDVGNSPSPSEQAVKRTARAWVTAEIVDWLWPLLTVPIVGGIAAIVWFDIAGIKLSKTSALSGAAVGASTVGAYLSVVVGGFVLAHTVSRLTARGAEFSATGTLAASGREHVTHSPRLPTRNVRYPR